MNAEDPNHLISQFVRRAVTESEVLSKLPTITDSQLRGTVGPNKWTWLMVAINSYSNELVLALLDMPEIEPQLFELNLRLKKTPLSLAISNSDKTLPPSTILKLIRKYPVGAVSTHVPGQRFVPIISHSIGVLIQSLSVPENRRYLANLKPVLVELVSRPDAGLLDAQTRAGLTGFEFVMSKRLGPEIDRAATNNYHVQRMLSRVAVDPGEQGRFSHLLSIVCDRMRSSFAYMQQITTILRSFPESRDINVRTLCQPLVSAEAAYVGEEVPTGRHLASPVIGDGSEPEAIEEPEALERVPLTQDEQWAQFAHPDELGSRLEKRDRRGGGSRKGKRKSFSRKIKTPQTKTKRGRHSKNTNANTRRR